MIRSMVFADLWVKFKAPMIPQGVPAPFPPISADFWLNARLRWSLRALPPLFPPIFADFRRFSPIFD